MKSTSENMVSRRHPFSLIEVLVAIAILAIVGSALSLSFGRLLDQQRFRTATSTVVEVLQQAQEIHLLYDTDVIVYLNLENGLLRAAMLADKPLPFILDERRMKGIERITFDGSARTEVKLEFLSSGSRLPKGILSFRSRGGEVRWVPLSGYLAPIKEMSRVVDLPTFDPTESYERYPKELI